MSTLSSRSSFLALPVDIQSRIAASLIPAHGLNFALTCRSLDDIAEPFVWDYVDVSMRDWSEEDAELWGGETPFLDAVTTFWQHP